MKDGIITQEEQEEIVRMMAELGFQREIYPEIERIMGGTTLYFSKPLSDPDRAFVMSCVEKGTFIPYNFRTVSVFDIYVTSGVSGDYRGYRCRKWNTFVSFGSVFGKCDEKGNVVGHVREWIKEYKSKLQGE